MKIYDCFPFFNELDLLEIRLNELNDVVDGFVLVESERSHQNKSKPLYYNNACNEERFAKFKHKIKHIIVKESEFQDSPWYNENLQRAKILDGISELEDDDLLIVSDLDEIPSQDAVKRAIQQKIFPCVFNQIIHYLYLNTSLNMNGSKINYGSVLLTKREFAKDTECVRNNNNRVNIFHKIENGGWHFSFLGNVDHVYNKLQNYAHNEFNGITKENIQHSINNLTDVLGRGGHSMEIETDLSYLPKYVIDNKNKFSHYFYGQKKIVVQIGACRGNDHVTKLAQQTPCQLFLVEANINNIEPLKQCYQNQECKIENIAIVPNKTNDEITFYYSENDGPLYEVSSVIKQHVLDYYNEMSIKSYNIKCLTLDEYLTGNNLTKIDYLFLDVEGIDAEVFLNFPLEKYDIKNIQIEFLHLKDKKESVEQKFATNGYILSETLDLHNYDKMYIKYKS